MTGIASSEGVASATSHRRDQTVRTIAGTIVAFVTLVGFALRVFRLKQQSLTGDEAFSMLAAQRWLAGQMEIYGSGSVESTPPLHYLLLHFWTLLAGPGEFSGRFVSAIAGALLVPVLYRLGVELGSHRVGLVAAILAAVNPFLILYSQTARSYSTVVLLSAVAALALVRLLGAPSEPRYDTADGVPPGRWLVYVVATLLALYTHTLAALLLVFHNFAWLAWPARKVPIRNWLLAQALIVLLYLPWAARAVALSTSPQEMWLERGALPTLLSRVLSAFTIGQATLPRGLALALVVIGILLFALGLMNDFKSDAGGKEGDESALGPSAAVLALGYWLAPLLAATVLSLHTPLLRDRFLIVLLPGYLLGVALGVDLLWRRWLAAGLVAVALATAPALFALPGYYRTISFASVAQVRELQTHVRSSAGPGSVAVVNLPATDPYFQYYDLGIPTAFISDARPEDREAGVKRMDEVLREYRDVWLVPFKYGDEADRFVERKLSQSAYKVSEGWFGNIRLVRYAVQEPAPAAQSHPIEAAFKHDAGIIWLLGYSLGPARPGGVLSLTLYWKPDGPTARPYTVFTHLYDAQGKRWAQLDGEPVGGQRPTTGWTSGEEVADKYGLALPSSIPPGDYRLEVGLYNLQDGSRLPLATGENRLVLASVPVRPQ